MFIVTSSFSSLLSPGIASFASFALVLLRLISCNCYCFEHPYIYILKLILLVTTLIAHCRVLSHGVAHYRLFLHFDIR